MSLVTRKQFALFCAAGASAFLIACNDAGSAPDARIPSADAGTPDGSDIDAPPAADAAIDATPTVYTGTVAVNEVSVNGHPEFGQGVQANISFSDNGVAPSLVTGSMLNGCTVTEFTAAQAANPGLDEGTVEITSSDGSPVIPPCHFAAQLGGYKCVAAMGAASITVTPNPAVPPAPISTSAIVTITGETFTDAQVLGNYINISGATNAANNGTFPIVQHPAGGTLVVALPAGTAETFNGGFLVMAGIGPIPGKADPGFLADDANLTVKFTPGTGAHIPAFNVNFGTAGAGNDFELDTASKDLISAIPTDGSQFVVGCDSTMGCGANSALGQVLVIDTTDATPSASPVDFPLPATKRVTIQCVKVGGTSVTVPANVSEFIKNSGAKRIRALFLRVTQAPSTPTGVNVISGHGIVGFTDPS